MTYLMSDLHGQYELYMKMLEKIRFSDRDELYVLGDIVDRGPKPMAILRDMSLRINVFPFMGNHDMTAKIILSELNKEITSENLSLGSFDLGFIVALKCWIEDGGGSTLEDFRQLSPDEREDVLAYLDEFIPCDEIEVNGTRYVLAHAGVEGFSPDKPLTDYAPEAFIDGRCDYGRRYFPDKILVTGHTPTLKIDPACKGKIWQGNGHIALDCGAGYGLPLGCIRLEDMQTFYVE